MIFRSACIFFASLFCCVLSGQSGYLDLSFGDEGIVVKPIGTATFDFAQDALLQPDHKIVVAGQADNEIVVARFLPNGDPDSTFHGDGIARFPLGGTGAIGHAVALQPDGKLVVAAATLISGEDAWAVVRLQRNGEIDSTFGQDGFVKTNVATGFEYPNEMAIQQDGKIVVAGKVQSKTFTDMAVVRYTSDGRLDEDFGTNGIVVTDFRQEDEAWDLVIQRDGKIIIAGFSSVQAVGDFAMARYTSDGDLDPSFGDGGKVLTDFNQGSDFAKSIALLPNGKILLSGNADYFNLDQTSDIGIARYNSNGILDSTFATYGLSILTEGEVTDGNAMAVQPDGKILITGRTDYPNSERLWFLTRVLPDGTRDSIFGDNGIVQTDFPGMNEFGNGVMITHDSRIIVFGASRPVNSFDFAVARYIADFIIEIFVTPHSCFGANDGSIDVFVTGGVPPYQYIYTDAGGGAITLQVTDALGVSAIYSPIFIPEPPPPPAVTVTVLDDQIEIHISDDSLVYLISLNGGPFTSDTIFTDLPDGLYTIEVIDENMCPVYSGEVVVDATSTSDVGKDFHVSVFPNPSQGQFFLTFQSSALPDAVEVYDAIGNFVLLKRPIIERTIDLDLTGYPEGLYIINVVSVKNVSVSKLILSHADR